MVFGLRISAFFRVSGIRISEFGFNPKSEVETTDGHRWTQIAKE